VDGVALPYTTMATPAGMNGFHMAVNPGGATYFQGEIDETRIFTFAPGAFNPATDLSAPVPESSTVGVVVVASLGLGSRRRRHFQR
jgi:hypothetical protein